MHLSLIMAGERGSFARRLSMAATAAALVAAPTLLLADSATAAALPAPYTASASGDILTVSSTLAGAPLAAVDLIHADAVAGSTATPRTSATSANLGAQVGPLGAELSSRTATAPPSSTDNGTVLQASLASPAATLGTGTLTAATEASWAGDLACLPLGTPLSTATTSTTGATTSLLGIPVLATGDASTTATTSLVAQSATNDTRSVQSTATGNVSGLTLLGAITVSALQPTLTATATSGAATSASLTGSAVTLTYPGGSQVLDLGDTSAPVSIPLVGTATVHVASNADVAANGGVFSTTFLTVDISLLAGAGTVSVGVLPLSVSATAPLGGVECTLPVIAITAPAEGSTTGDSTPTISGTSNVPNGTVTITIGAETHTVTTDASGDWTFEWPTPLANGPTTVTASVTNAAGNTASDTNAFTVSAPMPTIDITTPASGSTVTDTTPAVSGTSNVLSGPITLVIDGAAPITVTTESTGAWTYTPAAPLAEGPHTVGATATTPAGTATDTTTFTVSVPPAVEITAPTDGSTTTDQTPTITGTSSVLSGTITLAIDDRGPVSVPTNASGDWTYTPTVPLSNGVHGVEATATNVAGDSATDSAEFEVLVEGPLPEVTISTPADGSTTTDRTPDITGTSDQPNSVVLVSIDGGDPLERETDPDGNWGITPTSALSCGLHDVVAITGNEYGMSGDEVEFTVRCPVASPIPQDGDDSLAHTGTDVAPLVALGLVLLLGGVGLLRRAHLIQH
jgi:hypothetical protein